MQTQPFLIDENEIEVVTVAADRAAMQSLVDEILGRLVNAGIPYCLLRNRHLVPSGLLGWSDLDLMVSSSATFERLCEVWADLNPANIVHLRHGRPTFFFPVAALFLRVDVFNDDVEWRSVPFVDHEEILKHRRDDNGIAVASEMHQAYVVWFSKLLWAGVFSQRYETFIQETVRAQPVAFRQLIANAFGDQLARELVQLALDRQASKSIALVARCRRALWKQAIRQHPIKTLRASGAQFVNGINQRMHPTGLRVVLLGPDGSGKTSISTRLTTSPSRNIPCGNVSYRLLYHRILPPISVIESKIRRRPRRRPVNPQNPHGNTPHRPVFWAIKQSYYTVDQWLSEVLWTRTKLAHTELILLDRHFIELQIDPRRYKYTGPLWVAQLFARLAPKPDLYIVLHAPADVVQSRKQDVTFEETERQLAAYRAFAESSPQGRLIDSTQPLDKVERDVLDAIADTARRRTITRYRLQPDPSSGTPGTVPHPEPAPNYAR